MACVLAALLVVGFAPDVAGTHSPFEITLEGLDAVANDTEIRYRGTVTHGDLLVPGQPVEVYQDGDLYALSYTYVDGEYIFRTSFETNGTHTLQTVVHRGTPAEDWSDVLEVQADGFEPDGIPFEVVDHDADRGEDKVYVWFYLDGRLVDGEYGIPNAEVNGTVEVVKDNPCWDQPSLCVNVQDVQTLAYETTTAIDGEFETWVGPYNYTAVGYGTKCHDLEVNASAAWQGQNHQVKSWDESVNVVCA